MIRSLWTSASALMSHQIAVDAIGNNVSNVNTTGFKRNTTVFQDLFYQEANALGEFEPNNESRTGISIGAGTRLASTNKVLGQGRLEPTGNTFDLALEGEGYFRVMMPDGTPAYTRDGGFRTDVSGRLVTAQGYMLDPSITIPEGAKDVTIEPDGTITAMLPDETTPQEIGQITVFIADNPYGMRAIGQNMFTPSDASGALTETVPGSDNAATLHQGFLEGSNVELADEMTQLVITQRAYQLNAQALKTAQDMLQVAINIRG